MYKSYSYNNMPEPVNTTAAKQQPKPVMPPKHEHTQKKTAESQTLTSARPIRNRLQSDDMIILIIIIILIMNDCDDKMLLLALAYIFMSD